mmetsp:Transcript_10738/g.16294  ORF Transcript_10738/g.16294 Transcript_10738/m.16294 type:complete len:629 (+) Transcript_10738:64-1950(+)
MDADISSPSESERAYKLERRSTSAHIYDKITEVANVITKSEDLYPWANVLLIAVAIGVIEYLPAAALAWTVPLRFRLLDWMVSNFGLVVMILTNIALSMACVCGAVLLTLLVAPSTAGSGVPQLGAYLCNGEMVSDDFLSIKAVAVKMIGVVMAISGGLAIGREGPAIHIGAAIGDLTNRLVNKTIRVTTGYKIPFDGFVKSNVVMMGAASGFASAFRAPIGGMLYCLEEIATHWDIRAHMTVGAQMFVAVAVSAFITDTIVRSTRGSGGFSFSSIIIFDGDENELYDGVIYTYTDIVGFLLTAIVCGVVGGLYTKASIWMHRFRQRTPWLKPWYAKVVDAAIVAAITAAVFSSESLLYTHCKHVPESDDDGHHRMLSAGGGERKYVQYSCGESSYSELASLSLTGEEGVIRHLLSRDSVEFQLIPLLIFLVTYTPLTVLVRGLPIPCGSFVPNLLLGSLIGRIIGEFAEFTFPNSQISEPGVYALVGAAAQLGAWTRTMMAVVVTLVEITGDIGLAGPLICCVVLSRGIATQISHHSFTHVLFYDIVDRPGSPETPMLHPNDWEPPGPKSRRLRRTSDHGPVSVESDDAMYGESASSDTDSYYKTQPPVAAVSTEDITVDCEHEARV